MVSSQIPRLLAVAIALAFAIAALLLPTTAAAGEARTAMHASAAVAHS